MNLRPKLLYLTVSLFYYSLYTYRHMFIMEKYSPTESHFLTVLCSILFITFFVNIFIGYLTDKYVRIDLFLVLSIVVNLVAFELFFSSLAWEFVLCLFILTSNCQLSLVDKFVLSKNVDYGNQAVFCTIGYVLSNYMFTFLDGLGSSGVNSNKIGSENILPQSYSYFKLRVYHSVICMFAIVAIFYCMRKKKTPKNEEPSDKETDSTVKKNIQSNLKNNLESNLLNKNTQKYPLENDALSKNQIIEKNKKDQPEIKESVYQVNKGKDTTSLFKILRNKHLLVFLFFVLLNGITRNSSSLYMSKFISTLLPSNSSNLSNTSFMQEFQSFFYKSRSPTIFLSGVVFEFVVIKNSKFFIKRLGYYNCFLLAQILQLLRFSCYSFFTSETSYIFPKVITIELLKGFNYGLTHVSAVNLCYEKEEVFRTSAQLLYSGVYYPLSYFFVGIVFTHLFQINGDFLLFFRVNATIVLITVLLFFLYYGIIDKKLGIIKKKQYKEESEKNKSENSYLKGSNKNYKEKRNIAHTSYHKSISSNEKDFYTHPENNLQNKNNLSNNISYLHPKNNTDYKNISNSPPKQLKLLENTKIIYNTENYIEIIENTENNTKFIDNTENEKKIVENTENNTKIVENTRNNSKIIDNINNKLKIVENINNNLKIGENINNNLKIIDNINNITKFIENTNNNSKIIDNINDSSCIEETHYPSKVDQDSFVEEPFISKISFEEKDPVENLILEYERFKRDLKKDTKNINIYHEEKDIFLHRNNSSNLLENETSSDMIF